MYRTRRDLIPRLPVIVAGCSITELRYGLPRNDRFDLVHMSIIYSKSKTENTLGTLNFEREIEGSISTTARASFDF